MSSASPVSPVARRAIPACLGSIAFSLVFTGASFRALPVPWYEPLARRWVVTESWTDPASPAMDWYGRLAVASVAAATTTLLAWAVLPRVGREPVPGSFAPAALTINTLVLVWVCALLYGWTLAHRSLRPTPPLPFESPISNHGSQASPR